MNWPNLSPAASGWKKFAVNAVLVPMAIGAAVETAYSYVTAPKASSTNGNITYTDMSDVIERNQVMRDSFKRSFYTAITEQARTKGPGQDIVHADSSAHKIEGAISFHGTIPSSMQTWANPVYCAWVDKSAVEAWKILKGGAEVPYPIIPNTSVDKDVNPCFSTIQAAKNKELSVPRVKRPNRVFTSNNQPRFS